MNFFVEKIILWLKSGEKRELRFVPDKVNIITGNSKTGKTAILEILDYCFCGNETVTISAEHIGENVSWYGVKFHINDKIYTIARGEISACGTFSNDYYFSQTGEIPQKPVVKMHTDDIKAILGPEFSITSDIPLAYGGNGIKKGTSLSFRYFLIFNTLSKDIIDNGRLFFDNLDINRYRDVWPQIIDLALGVIDFDILHAEKQIADIKKEKDRLAQQLSKAEKLISQRSLDVSRIVKHAKEAELIDECLSDNDAFEQIEHLIDDGKMQLSIQFSIEQKYEDIIRQKNDILLQLCKLKRFEKSYQKYKKSLKDEADALKPISYISQNFTAHTNGEYRAFLESLSIELSKIKDASTHRRPFEYDIEKEIRDLQHKLDQINTTYPQIVQVNYKSIPTADKLVSLGEIKSEYYAIASCDANSSAINEKIEKLDKEIERLRAPYTSIEDNRTLKTQTLNDYIQEYILLSQTALDEYGSYSAWFNRKKAILSLRKMHSAVVANISSSSDHLFMHLCLFAGLHEMFLSQNSPFIPSFLIMDQPSRPYFNSTADYQFSDSKEQLSNKDDWSKVRNIFSLWDSFFEKIKKQNKHFQIIILEHVEESAWDGFENMHLVEIFDGIENALIPPNYESL